MGTLREGLAASEKEGDWAPSGPHQRHGRARPAVQGSVESYIPTPAVERSGGISKQEGVSGHNADYATVITALSAASTKRSMSGWISPLASSWVIPLSRKAMASR